MTTDQLPSVAIIMRTRNRAVLLDRAVRDVLAQTFTNWMLVVVNDGGNASEVDSVIERHRRHLDGRVRILNHQVSRGMEAASNAGIAGSESEFIAIHDDDDTWHPDFLQRTVDHLRTADDAGVGVRTEIVYERLEEDLIQEVSREIFEPEVRAITLFDTLRSNRCVPISLLYRRSVHDSVGYYDEDLDVVGDWEFQLRMLQGHHLGFIDGAPLAFWHQRREATGDLGNSVIASDFAHLNFDRTVREKYLRNYAAEVGLGGLLYLTKHQDAEIEHFHRRQTYSEGLLRELIERSARTEERLRSLEESISDASLVSFLRRRYRRAKDRLRRK
ncbi:glycosyltransferase family 2 protein [Pseudarthrobacter albicanus]|uniref:glycosyltransferase family 2 protein n=1 Tax=Pseudarthrobacter albicanus TaxID=2823873 RepID=UPI001BA99F3B|nr:glycosyltransferase [Pseudarthrobacter albicanus]